MEKFTFKKSSSDTEQSKVNLGATRALRRSAQKVLHRQDSYAQTSDDGLHSAYTVRFGIAPSLSHFSGLDAPIKPQRRLPHYGAAFRK